MPYVARFTPETLSRAQVDAQPGPLVLEFGTDWCGHCQGAQPLIQAALAKQLELPHIKVEDGPGQPLGRSYRVKLWPTLVFLRDGAEVARLVRPQAVQDIRQALSMLKTAS